MSDDVLASITKSWAGLATLLLLFLLIAQFIAYFSYSNIAQVSAVKLGDWLEEANIGAVWLLIGFVFVTMLVDIIMPAAIAKWAILAPIFIPLFLRLDVAPQTVLAAYRVGDSPLNVVMLLMAYFPLIIIFAQRYRKDAGIGTVVAMMLPYVVVLSDHLDALLRRLVPARNPAGPRLARPPRLALADGEHRNRGCRDTGQPATRQARRSSRRDGCRERIVWCRWWTKRTGDTERTTKATSRGCTRRWSSSTRICSASASWRSAGPPTPWEMRRRRSR